MPFYLKLQGAKLQNSARNDGFDGQDWRERVLADLLHNDELVIAATSGETFNLYGRLYRAMAVQDKFRTDTLFVFGLFDGPARGERIPPDAVTVSGPWHLVAEGVHREQSGLPASDHIRRFLGARVQRPEAPVFGTLAQALTKAQNTAAPDAPVIAARRIAARGSKPKAVAVVDMQAAPTEASTAVTEASPEPIQQRPPTPSIDPSVPAPPQRSPSEGPSEPRSSIPHEVPAITGRASLLERLPTRVREYVGACDPQAALRSVRQALTDDVRILQERLNSLPSAEQLDELIRRVDRVGELASELGIVLTTPASDYDSLPSIDRTLFVLESMAGPQWNLLPDWLAPRGIKRDTLLADDAASTEVEEALGWLNTTFADSVPESLASLQPSTGERLVERLRAAWQLHEERAHLRSSLAPLSPHDLLDSVAIPHLQVLTARVDELRKRLKPEVIQQIWAELPAMGIDGWLEVTEPGRFVGLPDIVVRSMTDWSAVDALLLHVQAGQHRVAPAEDPSPRPLRTADKSLLNLLEFDHPMTDVRGHVRSCNVAIVPPKQGQEVGQFTIAVRIKSRAPLDSTALLYLRTQHVNRMPAQAVTDTVTVVDDPSSNGNRCIRVEVAASSWYRVKSGTYYLDISVPVVAYRAFLDKLKGERAELHFALELIAGEQRLTGNLNFNRFHDGVPTVSVPQEDQTDLQEMKEAPLGVQPGYESIEQYVRKATKSFYVSAPRRFGKTTLLRYLEKVAAENDESAVFRITLDRHDSPLHSIKTVLRQLQKELEDRLRIEAAFPLPADGVPNGQTFRDARRQLAKKGYKNLVLLIDEAQSMVPRSDGGRWGTQLKDLIEGDLSTQSAEFARVCIVMAGTPQLPRRLGTNCRAFMDVSAERKSFDESELARFIRRISKDKLDSTARARDRLAKTANNLYTLKQLLKEAIDFARADNRAFIVSSDVDAATELLRERDESRLWDYVAAELSHTDEWDPIDAYPVALALAATQREEGEHGEKSARVWLDEQLASCGIRGTVPEARVQDGITELEQLGILSPDRTFKRSLLEHLLRRRTKGTPFRQDLDQIALARLAADVIAWDPRATPKREGGQADVFLVETDRAPQAWRVCQLNSANDRRRFVRTCAAIKVLRDVRTRLDGDRYLPRVRLAGFDIDDPTRGIIVYDWIEGESFSEDWKTASQGARLYVAAQVGAALDALQARGVVHRDVHPRNIVVDTALNAVLIDFGMACLSDGVSHSHVSEHDFMAPELREGTPATFASDLYALGQILKGPPGSDYSSSSPIASIVNQLTCRKPAERPTASHAVTQLRRLLAEKPFVATLERAQKDRDAVLEVALEREWLYEVLVTQSEAAAFRLAGLATWSESTAIGAATCLNGIFEAWVRQGETDQARKLRDADWPAPRKTPSLAAVRNLARTDGNLQGWAREEVAAVGALRIAGAHPSDRTANLERARQHDRNRNRLEVYAAVIKTTAQLLDVALGGKPIVERFITMLTGGK